MEGPSIWMRLAKQEILKFFSEWVDDFVSGSGAEEAADVPGEGQGDLEDPEPEAEVEVEGFGAAVEERVKAWNARWQAAVADMKKSVRIVPVIFVEPIPSKKASVTLKAVQRIYTRLRLLNLGVRRIHTDSGREFANKLLETWALSRDIAVTASVPSDPKSNGRVESIVGACKAGIRGLLYQSGLPKQCWPHCARQWEARKQDQAIRLLGGSPRKRPLVPSGTAVVVKKREWSMKTPWASKNLNGTAVAPSVRVPGATVVRIVETEKDKENIKLYIAPVLYTQVKQAVQFEGVAHQAEGEELPYPEPTNRTRGKSAVLAQERDPGESRGESSPGCGVAGPGLGDLEGPLRDQRGQGSSGHSGSGGQEGPGDGKEGNGNSQEKMETPTGDKPVEERKGYSAAVSRVRSKAGSYKSAPGALRSIEAEEMAWTEQQVEEQAGTFLAEGRIPTREEVDQLVNRALQGTPQKNGTGSQGWTLGLYSYGNQVGITNRTYHLPQTTLLLNRYLKSVVPGETWAAVRVTSAFEAGPHRAKLSKDSQFLVVPLSRFAEGRVFVEGSDDLRPGERACLQVGGCERIGTFVGGDEGPWKLRSETPYVVEPARERRTVLVAYTPYFAEKLSEREHEYLKEREFPIPYKIGVGAK